MADLRSRAEIVLDELEELVTPGSKKQNTKTIPNYQSHVKRTQDSINWLPLAKEGAI